ncbi:carbohydrate porin [Candidatus Gracilibacteria bacterium]|nr:carbohydrate porin [Candidatus Gracilibacteria bacterium]
MTRYEFATALNAFLTAIQQQLNNQKIAPEDLVIIKRLQSEFDAELGILKQQINSIETRITDLETEQFSATTQLTGEAIFALSDDFGEKTNDNLVFQYRTQLGLRTSFTGEDSLRMTLRSGNAEQFSYVENLTSEGRLGFDGDSDDRLGLSRVSYEFPIGDRISVFIAPIGDDVNASNPFFRDRGTGSISRFGRQNPIYRLIESGGIGLEYEFNDRLSLGLGYYNQEAEDSKSGDGLFNGDYSASAKLEFEPNEQFLLALLYVHAYNDTNLATGTGSLRSQLDLNRPVIGNSYSLETSWQLHPNFAIGGWVGFTDAIVLNLGEADVWNYALTLAFPDVGGEGNLLGVIVGQEPKLTNTSGFLIDGKKSDPDTSLHLEAFYRYQIRDNISITPGLIWITAPDHNNDNGDFVVLTIRTTFDF